jgi:hypothetical protein
MLKKPVKRFKSRKGYESTTYADRIVFEWVLNAIERYAEAGLGGKKYRNEEESTYA